METREKIEKIRGIQATLSQYHGAVQLKNIAELQQEDLLVLLGSSASSLTVAQIRQRLLDELSADAIALQSKTFQEAFRNKTISLGAQRLAENKRLELYRDYDLYELLQIAFSPAEYYFKINDEAFRTGNKAYNKGLYSKAIDAMIIDPSKVPQSSLAALGIKQLDPDCQNLKNVFKKMMSLKYTSGDGTKWTPTINTYDGKFITFSSKSVLYPVEGKATKGEERKTDVQTQMAVYPDLFSLLRREGHILEAVEEKKEQYQQIKNELISQIKAINRTEKYHGASVRGQVEEIILEIDQATNAKIVAQKLYKLYKVYGRNSANDKKLLESAITGFTKRIVQLIGISAHVQLHSLLLEDALEDQQSDLEMFHAQTKSAIAYENDLTIGTYTKLLFAFENYYALGTSNLKEPFLSFNNQIRYAFGDVKYLKKQDPYLVTQKADLIISLQRRFLNAYILEHQYKEGLISLDEVDARLSSCEDGPIFLRYPALYEKLFADIDAKQLSFSADFSYEEITRFFAELKNMAWLASKIDDLLTVVSSE